MGATVQTGHTKAGSGLSLVSLSLKSSQGEHVLALLQVHATAKEAKTLEKEFATTVKNALLETEGNAADRLDSSLKEVNGLLKGLLASKAIDDVHALLAILDSDNTLHVSHAGRAEAYIIRGGATSQITEYTRGKPTPAFVHIASGPLEQRDTIVFSTQRLLRTVTPAQLAKLAQRGDQLLDELVIALESEKEKAALAVMCTATKAKKGADKEEKEPKEGRRKVLPSRSARRRKRRSSFDVSGVTGIFALLGGRFIDAVSAVRLPEWLRFSPQQLIADLRNPKRRKRTHLLILAGAVAVFLVIWAFTNLATSSQRSQSRAELEQLVEEIDGQIRSAENRYLTGDVESANAILLRAEDQAKQIMDNESGLFRMESLDLLDRIRLKREEINNIVRLSPRVVVNLSAKNPDITAHGIIGLGDAELIAYDRQDLYRILLNSVDEPDRLTEEELIVGGSFFERMQTTLFQITDNSVIEIIAGQPTSMKTEDPAGWITGKDLETYLRYLYVLSPENNQIYKYERLSNRYSAPAEYNVNGDLAGALDMAIDGHVFILKEGGEVVKLFRGETRQFTLRNAPEGVLVTATKIFKVAEGNLYFLDPELSRVIVTTDGGATGEAAYVTQYVLEGDQIGELQDLYIDPEELHLYVLDEKRVYAVDLGAR